MTKTSKVPLWRIFLKFILTKSAYKANNATCFRVGEGPIVAHFWKPKDRVVVPRRKEDSKQI